MYFVGVATAMRDSVQWGLAGVGSFGRAHRMRSAGQADLDLALAYAAGPAVRVDDIPKWEDL